MNKEVTPKKVICYDSQQLPGLLQNPKEQFVRLDVATLALGGIPLGDEEWPGRNLPSSYDGKIIYSNPPLIDDFPILTSL